jgi:hypothetical protein
LTLAVDYPDNKRDLAGWRQLQRIAVLALSNFLLLFCAAGMLSESISRRYAASGDGGNSNRNSGSGGGGVSVSATSGAPRNKRDHRPTELDRVNSTTYEATTMAPAADGPAEPSQDPPRSREGRVAVLSDHRARQ